MSKSQSESIRNMINEREFYARIAAEVARLYPKPDFKPFESRYNKQYRKENKERIKKRKKQPKFKKLGNQELTA